MTSGAGRESEREQELRRLLAEAVEPVEPAPGAQTRLLARARAQQRRRQRPLMARLGVPVAVASLIAVVVLAVVFVGRANRGSSGSSASTAEAGGALSSRAAEASSAAGASAGNGPALAASPSPSSRDLSQKAAASPADSTQYSGEAPQPASLVPRDLDGDGRPDTVMLSAGTLKVELSRDGVQAVKLSPSGPGAKVLGVTSLNQSNGSPVAVVFVRLREVGSTATDTIAAVVNGRLTVLRLGSGPVLLTIDASHGYGCSQGTLAVSGKTTPFVVDGAQLVASAQAQGGVATAGKSVGCGF